MTDQLPIRPSAVDLDSLYCLGLDLDAWGRANQPSNSLIYRNGVSSQLRQIGGLAAILPTFSRDEVHPPKVVGSHISKSVKLPVSCFRFTPSDQRSSLVFIRDNFHDIKVVVCGDSPIQIPYHLIYPEWSSSRYLDEVERYIGYTKSARPPEGSDEWYQMNWSNGCILRKDGRIYRAGMTNEVYCEGIRDLGLPREVFKPYQDGMKAFCIEAGSYATVAQILEHVASSVETERFRLLPDK